MQTQSNVGEKIQTGILIPQEDHCPVMSSTTTTPWNLQAPAFIPKKKPIQQNNNSFTLIDSTQFPNASSVFVEEQCKDPLLITSHFTVLTKGEGSQHSETVSSIIGAGELMHHHQRKSQQESSNFSFETLLVHDLLGNDSGNTTKSFSPPHNECMHSSDRQDFEARKYSLTKVTIPKSAISKSPPLPISPGLQAGHEDCGVQLLLHQQPNQQVSSAKQEEGKATNHHQQKSMNPEHLTKAAVSKKMPSQDAKVTPELNFETVQEAANKSKANFILNLTSKINQLSIQK